MYRVDREILEEMSDEVERPLTSIPPSRQWRPNTEQKGMERKLTIRMWWAAPGCLQYKSATSSGAWTLSQGSQELCLTPKPSCYDTLLLLLLLWTLELYSILSYIWRSLDLLIISILSQQSYLGDLISMIYDPITWRWSKICFFISTLHYYLHAFDMPLTHVFHWRSTCILHMLLCNMLLPYT